MGRCGACSGKYHQIPSDGPRDARVVVYAERPGQWEESNARKGYTGYYNADGLPLCCLVGPTGREWNETYLPLAGLERESVFTGNVVQCGADSNRKPTQREARVCGANHIPEELAEINPGVVILMGATACSLVPEIDLEVEHGIPRQARLYDWEGVVVPIYHPALGLHEGSKMGLLLDDWAGVGEWMRGEGQSTPINEYTRDYGVIRTYSDLTNYCRLDQFYGFLGVDTESHGGEPFSVQFSHTVGSARLVPLESTEMVDNWVWWVRRQVEKGMELVFHNHPADLPLIESLGVRGFAWRDTMQEAYGLGLPQGLKALSYRILGRKRKSWEETVTPPSKLVLYDWLTDAIKFTGENFRIVTERIGKRGQRLKPDVEVSKIERTLKSVMNHMLAGEEYDPWAKLSERLSAEDQVLLGPRPVKGVKHLSLEELILYACGDADDCLALALEFERRRVEFVERVGVREEDWDQCSIPTT